MEERLRPVRITYVIGSLARGGAEGQLLELLRRLDSARWEPSLVLFEATTGDRATGLVHAFCSLDIPARGHTNWLRRSWIAATGIAKLANFLRRIEPDLVHAFLPMAFLLGAPAAKMAHVPVLVGSRRSLKDCYRTIPLLGLADRRATRMCDFVIGNSSAVTSELIHFDGIAPERTATIYNGVDIDRFRPGDRSFRARHGWSDEHVVFGIVANFLPYKRHTDFIRAAVQIAQKAPNARFVMAGEDRGILPELRHQIATSGLDSRFVIIPGTSEPEKLYPAMDAYICTSETEGFSNVLLEAAASGLPLIATNIGGNAEIVFPGENGYLVSVGQPDEVAQEALRLIHNRDLRLQMGTCSRRLVSQHFSLEKMVQQHEQLYERLLAARRSPVPAPARSQAA